MEICFNDNLIIIAHGMWFNMTLKGSLDSIIGSLLQLFAYNLLTFKETESLSIIWLLPQQ